MPTNAFTFGPVLDKVLTTVTRMELKMAEDFTSLTTALADLKAEVAASVANMDTLFADLTAALGSGNQAAVDAATAAVQTEIDNLKAAVTRDPPPP